MESLATVVFERTPQGAEQVNSNTDTLPRALRSVLLAVDGRSSVARYEPFLATLMPLAEKFAALEQLGLLRRKGSATDSQAVPAPPAPAPGATAAGLPHPASGQPAPDYEHELHALSRQMGLVPDNSARMVAGGTALGVLDNTASLVGAAGNASSTYAVPHVADSSTTAGVSATLKKLLTEMEAFLSQAVGLDGLPVVIMVAQINSIDQLRLDLPSYSELIRSYGLGAQSEAHISSLEHQLARCG